MTRIAAAVALSLMLGSAGAGVAQPAQTISASDKAIGAKANPDLIAEYGGRYAGRQADYVTRVGRRIAVQSGLSGTERDFTIVLLNSPVDNAFAIPGGYVYVTRDLMALMNDEAELAGVLGHEVGHVAARHSAKREAAAKRNSIFGALAQLAAGAFLGSGMAGQLANRTIGTGTQLATLHFSRAQETQADDLGVRYLAGAGYDPAALASMLASLQAQTDLEARIAGGAGRAVPSWASTHPDPGARVTRALGQAAQTKRTGGERDRDAFLAALDGMLYGDDPHQGIVDGRSFRHPDLRIGFTAPDGFALTNGADAVTIAGSGGQARFAGGPLGTGLDAYVAGVFATLTGGRSGPPPDRLRRTRINGLDAASLSVRADAQGTAVDVTVVAFQTAPDRAYHFVLLTPARRGVGPFQPMIDSFARLTEAQAAAIRARRVAVVTVGPRDTIATLAARMAYDDLREERFRALNALDPGATLTPGRKVKLIVYG